VRITSVLVFYDVFLSKQNRGLYNAWLWLSCTLRPSWPTERLLIDCRLTYLISLIRTVDKHVRFNVINRGYDFFRRQQRQTHQTMNDVMDVLITSVRLFQADFVGALDNRLRIVESTPGYAIVGVDNIMLKSRR